MRPTSLAIAVSAALFGCAQTNPGTPPPQPGQAFSGFYYPTGVAFVPDATGSGPGFVYVVSSDFDLRFNRGTLAAVSLAEIEPLLPAVVGATPTDIGDPHISSQVAIDVFGGPLALYKKPGSGPNARRIFVAGRQNDTLDTIDVDGELATCAANDAVDAGDAASDDCSARAVQLGVAMADAYRPVVVGNQVFVGNLTPKDDPTGSDKALVASLARVDAQTLGGLTERALGAADTDLGAEPVAAMLDLGGLLVLGGRPVSGALAVFNQAPLRIEELASFDADGSALGLTVAPQLDVRDVRAMALSSDRSRLYLTTRAPDALDILDVSAGLDGLPRFNVIGVVELPAGASELAVVARGPGRRDLVAITCQDANVVALYDDEIGRVVTELRGVGEQPFGIAAGPGAGGVGARLYTTAFGRGNIAITAIRDLENPAGAAVLATVGPNENCLNDSVDARPPECPQ